VRYPQLLLTLVSCTLAACSTEGGQYKAELVKTIQRADRIVVTEHSYEYDLFDSQHHISLMPDEVVYNRWELTGEQKNELLITVKDMSSSTQSEFSECIFEPHHTFLFYSDDKLLSTMEICFRCLEVEWDGSKLTPPGALYSGLGAFLRRIGSEPTRDWTAVAQAYRRDHPSSPVVNDGTRR
jgi:hypothetical protein